MNTVLDSDGDINDLARRWKPDAAAAPRRIERIEDLPNLEEVDGDPIVWILEGILAEGALHMLTSEPGAGKSTWISAAAYAICKGLPFMGRATQERPVLLLDAENPSPAVRERFARLRIKTDIAFRSWGQWVGVSPPPAGAAIVLDWVARCNPKPLIIVDSVIAFHPGAENDSNETRQYMEQYRHLTALGATVVLLHHIGKSETSRDYRGSSDYKASIDIGLKLTNSGDGARLEVLELRPFKQRFTVAPMMRILYRDGDFSLLETTEVTKSVTEQLSDLLKANPRVTKSQFEALAGDKNLGRNRTRDFLQKGIDYGTVQVENGPNNRKLHSWKESSD